MARYFFIFVISMFLASCATTQSSSSLALSEAERTELSSPEGAYRLAKRYEMGEGSIQKNPLMASKLYEEAAKKGHVNAMLRLGFQHLLGVGIPVDEVKAVYWFTKAADEGSAIAENELGFLYARGKGVKQDFRMALKWYERAANQGLASAEYNTGLFYQHGFGVPADQARAQEWFQKSRAHGFLPAEKALSS